MISHNLKTSLACLLLLITPASLMAQQGASTEVESLKKKIAEQEAQLNQLMLTLKEQQSALESLRQKVNGVTSAAAETSDKPDADAAEHKPAQTVETGYGKIMFHGLLQGWYAAGNGGLHDTFRLRHAGLGFSGEITPKARWTIGVDLAKALAVNNSFGDVRVNQASRILQDAFITLDYIRGIQVNVGQFKVPLGLEGLQPDASLDTVERALFVSDGARGASYGDVRDLGVMVSGPLGSRVDYQLGLFNGSGESHNDLDHNDQKAVAGRLVVRPSFIRGLQVGGSGVWGDGSRVDRPRRDRLGAEVLFARGPFKFKSELMTGVDSEVHRRGYYTHFGYRFRPKLEAIFRLDTWDPNTSRATDAATVTERDYIAGFNYFITENNLKFQINYLRKTFERGITPSRNLVLASLQTSW